MPWTDTIYLNDGTFTASRYNPMWHGMTVHDNATYPHYPGRTSLRTTAVRPNGVASAVVNWNSCRGDFCGTYLWFGQTVNGVKTLFRMNPQTGEIVSQGATGSGATVNWDTSANSLLQCVCSAATKKVYLLMGIAVAIEVWEVDVTSYPWTPAKIYTTASVSLNISGCIIGTAPDSYFMFTKGGGNCYYVNLTTPETKQGSFALGRQISPNLKYDGTKCYITGRSTDDVDGYVLSFTPGDPYALPPTVTYSPYTGSGKGLLNFTDGGDGYLYCINTSYEIVKFNKTTLAFTAPVAMDGVVASASVKYINGLVYMVGDDTVNNVGRLRVYNPKTGNYRVYDTAFSSLYADTITIINTGKHNWIFTYDPTHAKPFGVYRMSALEPAL